MCVNWKEKNWEEADRHIQAYKIVEKVEDGKYKSPLRVDRRDPQDIGGSCGTILNYETGKRITSGWPGVYLLEDAVKVEEPCVLLEVTIPKGTKFRRGRAKLFDTSGRLHTLHTINALSIVVGKRKHFSAPVTWDDLTTSTTTSDIVWGYATVSGTISTTTTSTQST